MKGSCYQKKINQVSNDFFYLQINNISIIVYTSKYQGALYNISMTVIESNGTLLSNPEYFREA